MDMTSRVCLFLVGIIALVTEVSADKGRCYSLPELYYANVAGRITGGVDVIEFVSNVPCSQLSFVDRRYRQLDGRCNHPLDHGSTFKPVKRYLKAHYQDKDGYNTPRLYSVEGGAYLPSPRLISSKLHPDQTVSDSHTMLVMQLGQLIDHDITSAPIPTETNTTIKCCGVPANELRPECFPIPIPKDDPVFDTCMEFVRSEPMHDEDDNMIYPREQMNVLTSFVDGSVIYGNDEDKMNRIRSENGHGALLNTRLVDGHERLPRDDEAPRAECIAPDTYDSYCQLAGDLRVNEQPALGSLHTLFHLHHNHLVRLLAAGILRKRREHPTPDIINKFIRDAPDYLKEKLFQEAKKILGAQLQKFTYCDWLPIVVGPALIEKFKLGCDRRSKYNKYVDPRVANAFLSAAFRFGHTLIPNKLRMGNDKFDLKDMFMLPEFNLRHYDNIINSLIQDGSEEGYDRFISTAVTNHLFESARGPKKALDLVAVNIQRGRDHGIPAYYYWRRYYRLKRLTRLDEFRDAGDEMKKVYKHMLDVDLFTGGLMESPVEGGLVGETFGHIIANQFADLKFGDAHFFLSKEVPQGFTQDQVNALLKTSIAHVICSNAKVQMIQENPYYIKSSKNKLIPCSEVPELDIEPWLIYF